MLYEVITFAAQKELGSYLELECLPQGGWGYELLRRERNNFV